MAKQLHRKKVILYNTSIETLLKYREKTLKKIQFVFSQFKKMNDVVLLWRPHPLIESTIESMCPELLEEYRSIVKQYREECWGIYDDTPDFHRAMAISDAYYGDWSSLVPLYMSTGKSIMIQDVNLVDDRMNVLLGTFRFSNVFSFNFSQVYFTLKKVNALFKLDIKSGEKTYLGKFCDEPIIKEDLFYESLEYKNKIFYAPRNAGGFGVYDVLSRKFIKIPLSEFKYNNDFKPIGFYIFGYKNLVYVFYRETPEVYTIDIDSFEVHNISCVGTGQNYNFIGNSVCKNIVRMLSATNNNIWEFNLETKESRTYKISEEVTGFTRSCSNGEISWYYCKDYPAIFKVEELTGNIIKVEYPLKYLCDFPGFYYYDNYIWVFSLKENNALKINIITDEIEELKIFDSLSSINHGYYGLIGDKFLTLEFEQDGSKIFNVNYQSLCLNNLGLENIGVSLEKQDIPEELYRQWEDNKIKLITNEYIIQKDTVLNEKDEFGLLSYCEFIKERKDEVINIHELPEKEVKNVGENINMRLLQESV